MAEFEVQKLTQEQYPLWDEFVHQHPRGSIFLTTAWLSQSLLPLEVHAVFDKSEQIRGGVALTAVKRYGIACFYPPPLTAHFMPLIAISDKKNSASANTEEYILTDLLLSAIPGMGHTVFYFTPGHHDILPYHKRGYSLTVRCTHEFGGSVDDFKKNLASRNVTYLNTLLKKVDEKELVVTLGSDADSVLHLWSQTGKNRQFNSQSELCRRLLPDERANKSWVSILVSDKSGTPLSGSILIVDNNRAYNVINGSVAVGEGYLKNVNMLTMYTAIQYCNEKKIIFDFEGSMLPGVRDFYRQMGGKQVPVYCFQKSRSPVYFFLRVINQYFKLERL